MFSFFTNLSRTSDLLWFFKLLNEFLLEPDLTVGGSPLIDAAFMGFQIETSCASWNRSSKYTKLTRIRSQFQSKIKSSNLKTHSILGSTCDYHWFVERDLNLAIVGVVDKFVIWLSIGRREWNSPIHVITISIESWTFEKSVNLLATSQLTLHWAIMSIRRTHILLSLHQWIHLILLHHVHLHSIVFALLKFFKWIYDLWKIFNFKNFLFFFSKATAHFFHNAH